MKKSPVEPSSKILGQTFSKEAQRSLNPWIKRRASTYHIFPENSLEEENRALFISMI